MSNIQVGSLKDNYLYIDFTGKTDPQDSYSFTLPTTGSTRISAEGFSGDINMELRDQEGKLIKSISTSGTNAATLSFDNLGAADYILNVSPISRDTNYQVSLTPNGKADPLTGLEVDSGFFTPDQNGQVGFDFLHDSGGYQGEIAIFSIDGMENLTPGSKEFIKEAARRALTDSELGHIVISDSTEGANPQFRGSLGEPNVNNGPYKGVKTFAMTPGRAFAVMLVPNGKVQDVFNNPNIGGDQRPLFSLSSSNPNDAWLYGQIADVTGDGKAFAMEDQRADGESDGDYNDIIFNLTGATGKAVFLEEVIDPAKDWSTSNNGKKLIDYVKSTLPIPETPVVTTPPVATPPTVETKPPVETPPVATPPTVETKPPVAITPPVETPPVETPPVATTPPVETPLIETPPVVTPPVATTPPVETPPVATPPTVETKPPVETPPVATPPTVETKPPVAITPPVETPPVETPPVATTPPVETPLIETPPVVTPPVATTPPVETPPVATPPTVETKPPVATPPVVTPPDATTPPVETPPVATSPTVETKPPVETPPVVITPPVETLPVATPPVETTPPVDEGELPVEVELPIETEPPVESKPIIDSMPFIGLIDTGFADNNPDLDQSNVTLGRDRVDKDSNPYVSADEANQHGTFTWGLISAIQGNDQGIEGINDQSPIYLSRAIGSGEWDLALNDFVSEAKAQKKKNAIAVLPLDLTQKNADGTITTRYEFTPRERAVLENARQNGVLVVVAAGNDGDIMSVLGQSSQEFENIMTIGSSDGFGRADYSSYGYGLDLLVAGGTIENPVLSTVGNDIGTMAGTSVAAARAAGMASVVWAANPDLNATQVIDVLTGSAIDLNAPGWDEETGFGVVNFNKAIEKAKETTPQSYTPPSFITPETWEGEGIVTPLERPAQPWEAAGDGRRKYIGWLDSSNPSDRLYFTVPQAVPRFQFSLKFPQGNSALYDSNTTLYDSNGNAISTLSYNPALLYDGLFGSTSLNPGSYYVLVNKGSQPTIDPYEVVLNFTGLSGDVKPLDDTIYLPRPNPTPGPGPIQVLGEIGKKYSSLGGEKSRLGKPVQNQVQQPGGFTEQRFEKGYIVWNGSLATAYRTGNVSTSLIVPSNIPSIQVDTSKNWKAEVYKWDRGSELRPPGKLSEATPQSNFLGSFSLGSNSQKGLKFDWGNGSPNGDSKFPVDNFVIKTYTDTDFEANKTYQFSARGDDGFRLFASPLNKPDAWELITPITDPSINPDTRAWWQEHYGIPPKEYTFTPKEAGKYRVVALFYDRASNANFDLSWKEVQPPASSGNYYPNIETVLNSFLSKTANTNGETGWAQKTIDEKWDRIGGESAQYGKYEIFVSGDLWQTNMPSDVLKVYEDLSISIFGSPKVVTTGYAYDAGYYPKYGSHSGIDIDAKKGTDVRAAVRGIVVKTEFHAGNGSWIAIDELDNSSNKTGRRWWYGHLSEMINVKTGDIVIAGKTKLASTNDLNHLHLAVLNTEQSVGNWNDIINGKKLPLNPQNYDKNVRDVLDRTISPLEAYWKSRNGMKE